MYQGRERPAATLDVFAARRHSCTDQVHTNLLAGTISAVNRYLADNIPSNRFVDIVLRRTGSSRQADPVRS